MTNWAAQPRFGKSFWIGCVILFAAVVVAAIAIVRANDARKLSTNGIILSATVLDQRRADPPADSRNAPTYFVTYTFAMGDQTVTNERDVAYDFYDAHPIETTWDIRVHPDRPNIHDLFEGQTRADAWQFLFASVIMTVFGGLLMSSSKILSTLRARGTAP